MWQVLLGRSGPREQRALVVRQDHLVGLELPGDRDRQDYVAFQARQDSEWKDGQVTLDFQVVLVHRVHRVYQEVQE